MWAGLPAKSMSKDIMGWVKTVKEIRREGKGKPLHNKRLGALVVRA
jgi:hypothetical protein